MSEPHDAASVGEVGQVPMRPDGVAVGVLGPCLEPVMVLSTAHLNRETARQLEAGEDFGIEDVWRPRYGYGFLVGAVRAAHESGSVPDCLAQAGALAGACGRRCSCSIATPTRRTVWSASTGERLVGRGDGMTYGRIGTWRTTTPN